MKFQIEKLILWPKKVKYNYKAIDFDTNSVNVITGDSRTGKSAIIPTCNFDREQNFTKILHEKTTADRLI